MQQHNASNSSSTAPVSTDVLILSQLGVLAVCFILGVPANIAAITRLAGWLKKIKSFTPRLMLSLAISDLLTLLTLPFWIWSLLHGWVFGLVLCKLLSYVVYLSLNCSILCVTLMSVQRYLQVLHPDKWNKLGKKEKKILLTGMWILSGVSSCYALIQSTVSSDSEGQVKCELRYHNNVERVATLIGEIKGFVFLFLTIIYFYFKLYHGVHNSAFFKNHSLTKLVTRIVACFFIFWIANQITDTMIIFAVMLRNDNLLKSAESAEKITSALTFFNNCVNPFLYVFSARALQQTAARENA